MTRIGGAPPLLQWDRMEKQKRPLTVGFLAAVACLILFGWLATDLWRGETFRFDTVVRDAVHSVASPELTVVVRAVTQLGSSWFVTTVAILLVWRLVAMGRRRAALILAAASVGGEALDQILKIVFRRPRPEVFFGMHQPSSYSFPSGHSVESACFYGVVAAILTVRIQSKAVRAACWTAASVLVLCVGLSRIYLGVHYPSDVLAGYAVAVIWVSAVRFAYERWLRQPKSKLGLEDGRDSG